MKRKILAGAMLAMGLLGAQVSRASLISVGPGLVYDNVANVTWSSDANLLGTMEAGNANLISQIIAAVPTIHDTPNSFDNAGPGNYNVSASDFNSSGGPSDWWGAMAFMGYLNSIDYLGHNTWELPTTYDQSCFGYNCTNSMLGELFYTALGGTAGHVIPASSLFTNVFYDLYWSSTEDASNPGYAWEFTTFNGAQGTLAKNRNRYYYSWAVLPGNAGAAGPGAVVPEPAGLALFGIGLFGVMAVRRRSA